MVTFHPKCIILFITIASLLNYLCESRHHKHHHSHPHSHSHSEISMPPSAPPSGDPDPAEAPTSFPTNIFDVRDFGAVGDGVVDDTDAFKSAWDAACNFYPSNSSSSSSSSSLPSLIHAPLGYTFMVQPTIFTGPCLNHLVFQIDGFVVAPDGPESWPDTVSKRQWLIFYKIDGMSLLGGGCIDGRGHKWWDLPCKPHKGVNGTTLPGPCDSPIAIRFFESSNLRVKGLKIKDSPQFNFRFDNCDNVHVESIQITAPPLSPNTDGIHIENTNNVGIYNSLISNGDDCVSIGSGCYDVDIRNMTCWHGHGVSIGSLGNHNSKACVHNVTVRDSLMKLSNNGVRIKTWQGGSGSVSGVRFENIHMDQVRNPIIIDQFYCLGNGCTNKTSAVWVNDIVYSNLKGTYDVRSPPMHFACSDAVPCANITLSDIELLPSVGEMVLDPFCWNVYGNLETLTIPPVSCLLEGEPPQPSMLESGVDHC